MNKLPLGPGACCLPGVEGITYVKLGPQGDSVGMVGLKTIFQQLLAMGRRPEDAADAELVDMARKFNWIGNTEAEEADYAAALRLAYAVFYAHQEKTA